MFKIQALTCVDWGKERKGVLYHGAGFSYLVLGMVVLAKPSKPSHLGQGLPHFPPKIPLVSATNRSLRTCDRERDLLNCPRITLSGAHSAGFRQTTASYLPIEPGWKGKPGAPCLAHHVGPAPAPNLIPAAAEQKHACNSCVCSCPNSTRRWASLHACMLGLSVVHLPSTLSFVVHDAQVKHQCRTLGSNRLRSVWLKAAAPAGELPSSYVLMATPEGGVTTGAW